MSEINKDIYTILPEFFKKSMDEQIEKYENKIWFIEAWNDYCKQIANEGRRNVPSPGAFFSEYEFTHSLVETIKEHDIEENCIQNESIDNSEENCCENKDNMIKTQPVDSSVTFESYQLNNTIKAETKKANIKPANNYQKFYNKNQNKK